MEMKQRARLQPEDAIFEVDLTDLELATPADVDALYDALEGAVGPTGRKWWFLINYLNCRIHPEAWIAFANRGKRLNVLYGLGSVRFNTAEDIGDEIARRAEADSFDANLAANRAAAMAKLEALRRAAPAPADPAATAPSAGPDGAAITRPRAPLAPMPEVDRRVSFDPDSGVLDVDLGGCRFDDSAAVDRLFDRLEALIGASGRDKWYFVVNYRDCQVAPDAWIAFANRGKRLNVLHSLGSVRYAACDQNSAAIEARAQTENFDPNLFPTREAALAQIDQMRAGA